MTVLQYQKSLLLIVVYAACSRWMLFITVVSGLFNSNDLMREPQTQTVHWMIVMYNANYLPRN